MIIIGDSTCLPKSNCIQIDYIYNLSSALCGYEPLNLMPPENLPFTFDNTFDKVYYSYIFENESTFMEIMGKVILNEYNNKTIFILVSRGDAFDYITESLIKMIQARYGILCNFINDQCDYETINDTMDASFTLYGLPILDADKERFREIVFRNNPDLVINFEDRDD